MLATVAGEAHHAIRPPPGSGYSHGLVQPVEHASRGEPGGADLAVRAGALLNGEGRHRLGACEVIEELLRLSAEEGVTLSVADEGRAADALGHAAAGRRLQRLAHEGQLFALIEIERLAEQRLLVAEGGVKAGPGHAHGLGQVA